MDEKINFDEEIKKIKKAIIESYNPEKIILFGSCARGDYTEDSDVDIFVIKKTDESPRERIRNLTKKIPHNVPVDVIIYTPEEFELYRDILNSFVWLILQEGKLIYERVGLQEMA